MQRPSPPPGEVGPLSRAIHDPRLYVTWAVLVLVVLPAAYVLEPYLFALAGLAATGASVPMFGVGLTVALRARAMAAAERRVILLAVLFAAAASGASLLVVRGIAWG